MFGITKRREFDSIVTLDLHATSPGEKRPAIIRNRFKKTRRNAGITLYHRADQIFLRGRISDTIQAIFG